MAFYEYKVVPAPSRAGKIKGARGPAERFAMTLAGELNAEAGEGWEFLRAETLPVEERKGLTGTRTTARTVLIYRRDVDVSEDAATREALRLLESRADREER
jgi:hypothetical protein